MRMLNASQWDRYSALLERLQGLPADQREAVLRSMRAQAEDDPSILRYVSMYFQLPPEPPEPDRCRTGEQIGNFTLGDEIGSGGMGVVYRARQTTDLLDRDVALKFIHPALVLMGQPNAVERFKREIETLVKFDHEGIAQIYDGGIHIDSTTDEQLPFFAMQLIQDGLPITVYAQEYDLTILQRLQLFVHVCAALVPVHHQRVIHRDLKPTNILVDRAQHPFVIDFGLAQICDASRSHGGECIAGTPPYMSPEQVSAAYGPVSQRSDVYTLGVILYEMLTGQRPYALPPRASWEALRQAILTGVSAPLSQYNAACDGEVDTIVAKMLAKDPAARYATAAECQQALDEYLTEVRIARAVHRALQAPAPISTPAQALQAEPQELIIAQPGKTTHEASLTFITDRATPIQEDLFLKSYFDCYVNLFPEEERSDLLEMESWLDESRDRELHRDPWRYLWGVLHIGNDAIGVAEFSVHIDYPWAFGGYFGVLKGWRNQDRSEKFLRDAVTYLQTVMPVCKGIIFEIDSIKFDDLKEISADQDPITLAKRVRSSLRPLLRLILFQRHYAYPVLGSNGLPLPYYQPAMDEDMSEANEKELILMVSPVPGLPKSDINLQEIVDFVYDKLYRDSYDAEIGSVHFQGYRHYIAQVKRRVEEKMQEGWRIETYRISKEIKTLYRLARKQGLDKELDL